MKSTAATRRAEHRLGRTALLGTAWLLSLHAQGAAADPAPGNLLNPSGGDTTETPAPYGKSSLREGERRSPWGRVYRTPAELTRPLSARADAASLDVDGALEIGALWVGGSEDEARFEKYSDFSDGLWLPSIRLAVSDSEPGGGYAEASAGGVSRDDAYAHAEAGLPGWLRLRAFSSETPHHYARDAVPLFEGIGTDKLRLPTGAGLVPGANSQSAIAAALVGRPAVGIALQHDRHGVDVTFWPTPKLETRFRYTLDRREGTRAFGGGLLAPFGPTPSVETVEPLNQRTHHFVTSLSYAGDLAQWGLESDTSLFENRNDSLTWENPFALGGSGGANVREGRFALAPDNRSTRLGGHVAAALPLRGNLTAGAAWVRMTQNARLLAPTVNTGLVGFPGFNQTDLAPWNTLAARSRARADTEIDTWMANLRLVLRPHRRVTTTARVRFFERNDRTANYTAFNPLTGEIGYVPEDGGHLQGGGSPRIFAAGQPLEDFRFARIRYDRREWRSDLSIDGRLAPRSNFKAGWERRHVSRDNRERRTTDDDVFSFELRTRQEPFTGKLSYDYGRRRGAAYNFDPTAPFRISSLAGFTPRFGILRPYSLAQLHKSDLADRDRHDVQLRLHTLVGEQGDLAFVLRHSDDDYRAKYGLRGERATSLSLEWSHSPSAKWRLGLYGNIERRERDIASITSSGSPSSDPNAGGAVFPLANAWGLETETLGGSVGAQLFWQLHERLTIEGDYAFHASTEEGLLSATGASSKLPALDNRDHVVAVSARFALEEHVDVRWLYRYQRSRFDDFSQTGLGTLSAGSLFLGHVDGDYEASLYAVTLIFHL